MSLTIVVIFVVLLVCAAAIVLYVAARRNSNPEAHVKPSCVRLEDPAHQILWDIAEGGKGPVVKEGIVYLDRRRFGSRIAAAAAALFGMFVANKAQLQVPRRDTSQTDAPEVHAGGGHHTQFIAGSTASERNRGRYSDRNWEDAHQDTHSDSPTVV
jgi:hypothetical protein